MCRLILMALLSCMTILSAHAISSANMTYTCMGNNTYEVTLQVYYDCSASTSTSSLLSRDIVLREKGFYESGLNTNFVAQTITLSRDSVYEQNVICASASSMPNSCNGGGLNGLPNGQVLRYRGTVTLSYASRFILSFTSTDNRDSRTTLANNNTPLYIEVGIDNRNGCHSAPKFGAVSNPIYSARTTGENYFAYGGVVQGDYLIRYASKVPRNGFVASGTANEINYLAGYTIPILGTQFILDSTLGQISFVPQLNTAQRATIVGRAWMISKKGDTLGFVEDDRVLVLSDAVNFQPSLQISSILLNAGGLLMNPNNTLIIGKGEIPIFQQTISSPSGDTVKIDTGNTNLEAVFGVGNYSLFVQQIRHDSINVFVSLTPPTHTFLGEGVFTISYATQSCPLELRQIQGFRISSEGAQVDQLNHVICNKSNNNTIQVSATDYFSDTTMNSSQYFWQQIGGGNQVVITNPNSSSTGIILPTNAISMDTVEVLMQHFSRPNAITGVQFITTDTVRIHYDTTSSCTYSSSAQIQLWTDSITNCQIDSQETYFSQNTLLELTQDTTTYYVSTNSDGAAILLLDTGNYVVRVVPPNAYWRSCPDTQHIYIDTSGQILSLDFLLEPLLPCPKLEISIVANRLRRCFANNIQVSYSNEGYLAANNSVIEVTLDTNLYYNSATAPLISQIGNVYLFDGGSLGRNEQKAFNIDVTVSCSSNLGQIHCAEAHIYTDSICLLDISNIAIYDSCTTDSIYFDVTNLSHPYDTLITYWLLGDSTIIDTGSIQLNIGDSYTVTYPTTSSSINYQLVLAPQNANLMTASNNNNCLGYATRLPIYQPYSNIGYRATFCQPNTGSYDPNDKTGYPLGIGQAGYIPPNSAIDYRIRFQNTGTDTAIFINILDTIDADLDITTLQMGASSHAYTWQLLPQTASGQSVIRITYDSIYLPDSTTNLEASNGFVYYTIQQKPNLPNFVEINNSASIYFDYNTPIKTNTTLHTVCENCLPIHLNGVVVTNIETMEVVDNYRIYPNPTKKYVYIQQQTYQPNSQWAIHSLQGQLLGRGLMTNNLEQIGLENYSTGIYILTIQDEGQKAVFKLVVGE